MLDKNRRGMEKNEVTIFSLIGTVFLLLLAMNWLFAPMIDGYYVITDTKVSDLRYEVRTMRVLNSKDCLAFEDEVGRVHPATLNLSKLSGDNEADVNYIHRCSSLSDFNFKLIDSIGNQVYSFGSNIPEEVVFSKVFLVSYVDEDYIADGDMKLGLLEVNIWS
jgi:hypothetical protein